MKHEGKLIDCVLRKYTNSSSDEISAKKVKFDKKEEEETFKILCHNFWFPFDF